MNWKDDQGHKLNATDMINPMNVNPRKYRVGYWHFKPTTLRCDESGRWHQLKLRELPATERGSADGGKTHYFMSHTEIYLAPLSCSHISIISGIWCCS